MTPTDRLATARHSPSREPELLRVSGLPDLLAAVPSMIGLHPEDALVVVPFLGNRAGGGFRFPIPHRLRRAEIDQLAGRCERFTASISRATGVLAIVYTRQSYETAHGIPLLDLGRTVLRRLERTDLGIVGVACVAADGWGRYTSIEETREPRPLAEIEESRTGVLARAAAPEPLDVTALAALPTVSDSDRATVEAIVRHPASGAHDVIGLVERWLHGPPAPRQEATLIRVLQSPALRDQATLQIALGCETAFEERRRQKRLEEEQARTGRSMDELVEGDADAGLEDAHDLLSASLMMGTGPGPDLERTERATGRLARAAALAPVEARPPVLTVLAWCWWALGVSSIATRHLEEALRIDPHYSLAKLHRSVLEIRAVPDWVLDSATRSLDRAAAHV
jgi:hypothetical protein